ncbi:MAG: protein kinase domain-containing protein, partial [Bryobacteraceae bacterium]
DRAHRAGVTHRDVKPPNIMLTRDGVKVLDFGLAKSQAKPGPTEETLTAVLTTEGTIMGTPQYMAPEQFEGKEADARSDIWAFGAVLYEMVSGQKAFQGKSYSALLGAILNADPTPLAAPAWINRLLTRCLQKDPDDRYQSMRDVVLDLRAPQTETAPAAKINRWPWIAAVAVPTLVAAWLAVGIEKPAPAPLIRSTLALPPNVYHDGTSIAVSPDEKRVAFSARNAEGEIQLWVRPLDAIAAQPLAGTEGAADPFWSPDGQSIGFFADGKLKRIDLSGGPVLSLADTGRTENNRGASWGSTGVILFNSVGTGPLSKVAASGGAVVEATKIARPGQTHRRPWFLPDGKHFVFAAGTGGTAASKAIHVGSLDSTESTKLIDASDSGAIYSSGHLLFLRSEMLMAQPFDPPKLAISGDAAPIVESVPGGGIANFGGFSASAKGLLVHASGSRYFSDLTWFDRRGTRIATVGEPGNFSELNLSADRTRAAVTILTQQQERTVWLVDAVRGFRTPFSAEAGSSGAEFSRDGRMVFFASGRRLFRKRTDGGDSELVIDMENYGSQVLSLSPDGKFLLGANLNGLWILPDPLGEPGKSKPYQFPRTSPRASHGQFSPDGRWIAFQSDETGRDEIYVTPFPGPGVQRQISTAGGSRPRWRGDGREIFFLAPDGQIAASEVSPRNGELEAGEAKFLFNPRMRRVPPYTYDVSADGQRILAIVPRANSTELTIVQNWTALLKK